jgi:hypothetical protein
MKQLNAFNEAKIQEPFDFITESAEMPEQLELKKFKDKNQTDLFNCNPCKYGFTYPSKECIFYMEVYNCNQERENV